MSIHTLTGLRLFTLWRTLPALDFLRQIKHQIVPDEAVDELIERIEHLEDAKKIGYDTHQLRTLVTNNRLA